MRPLPRPNPNDRADRPPAYDWSRFGRHRLRAPAAALVDTPQPETGPAAVATVWPDARVAGGWAAMAWQPDPSGRGWLLPHQLALGDVIEFTTHRSREPVRWYGIVDTYDDVAGWLTLQGPYPTAADAHAHARHLLDLERYLPPVAPGVSRPVGACRRIPRPSPGRARRHRHR